MNAAFEFATATRVIFGVGRLREAGALAKEFGGRALLVTGQDPGRAQSLISILNGSHIASLLFPTCGEPGVSTVREGVETAKKARCDTVISFGGGSAIDTGKAIAAMLTNDGDLLDYLEVIGRGRALDRPSAPFIAIPTTAGTGSEVTRNSVLASPEHRVKVSLRSSLMLPRIALVDPELTYDLPPAITASTGLDALTQLIEPYVCSRANPITDALCVEGLTRVARALPVAFADGRDPDARENMSVASLFGGLALANAGLGAVHGFAGPIGGMFPAPHGAVCAALLPHAMDINLRALRQRQPDAVALSRYQTVSALLTGDPSARPEQGIDWVHRLVESFGIPPLTKYGITEESLSELADKSAKASSMKANPIVLTRDEMIEILQRAL
jgi:alcohol dehydrogenase class IV